MTEIRDPRLHEMLVRAELEDLQYLQKDDSRYLRFWHIAGSPVRADEQTPGRRLADEVS